MEGSFASEYTRGIKKVGGIGVEVGQNTFKNGEQMARQMQKYGKSRKKGRDQLII